MKLKKLSNGNVLLLSDTNEFVAQIPTDSPLSVVAGNSLKFGDTGVILSMSDISKLNIDGSDVNPPSNKQDLLTALVTDFFFKLSGGGGEATTNAAQITSGTLNDARLSGNVALKPYVDSAIGAIAPNTAFVFKAPANTEVSTALQTAINTYDEVIIDGKPGTYFINKPLSITSNKIVRGVNKAIIGAINPTGDLLNFMRYVTMTGTDSTIKDLRFIPPTVAFPNSTLTAWTNSVIRVTGQDNIIDNNIFDFNFIYGLDVHGVWLSGLTCKRNKVINNKFYTVAVRHCEYGASDNIIDNNYSYKSSKVGFTGTGNGGTANPCYRNQISNNIIEQSGNSGIEDQQHTYNSNIFNNTVLNAGLGVVEDNRMGISSVGYQSIVRNNTIKGFVAYGIEVNGQTGQTIEGNAIENPVGIGDGIFINNLFEITDAVPSVTSVTGNTITGCKRAIETLGNFNTYYRIADNDIQDPSEYGILMQAGGNGKSVEIMSNTLIFSKPSTVNRTGIFTFAASYSETGTVSIASNNVTYLNSATGGLLETGIVTTHSGAIISGNTINSNDVKSSTNQPVYAFSSNNSAASNVYFLNNKIFGTTLVNSFNGYVSPIFRQNNWVNGDVNPISVVNSLLPIDSTLAFTGDSITAHGDSVNNGINYYLGDGYSTIASIISGNKYKRPVGSNQGVAGENSTQILARLNTLIALNPKACVVMAGTNDVTQSVSFNTITSNLTTIYRRLKAIGCRVIAITIPTRFAPAAALSAANEAIRLQVNAWILANKDVDRIIDSTTILTTSTLFADGLHPNTKGDTLLGTIVGNVLNTLIEDANIAFQINPASVDNPFFTTGSPLATNWSIENYSNGATVTPTKVLETSGNKQIITVSGNYTNEGVFNYKQNKTSGVTYLAADVIEMIVDIEIMQDMVNISGISPQIYVYTASYAQTLAASQGYYPTVTDDWFLPKGRYTIKTPPVLISSGSPAIVSHTVQFILKSLTGSNPINAIFKIHAIGSRKIN